MTIKPFTAEEMAFLAQVDALPDGIDLAPEQAAIVLQVDTDWLRKKRQGSDGAGPPFLSLGKGEKAPVRYPMGALRKWKQGHLFGNTRAARQGSLHHNFSSFMANANLNEEWMFVEIDGRPVDAMSVEATESTSAVSMTLDTYLDRVRNSAREAYVDAEDDILFSETQEPTTPNKDRRLRTSTAKQEK